MKKILVLLLSVVLTVSLLLAGCSGGTNNSGSNSVSKGNDSKPAADVAKKDPKDITIGLSMPTQGAPYYSAQMKAAEEKAKELGCKFVGMDAGDDMNKQISDVEDLLAQGVDVILLNPKDPKGLVPATKAATEAGVPVIIIDSTIDPSADFVTTVQSNNTANGVLVGEFLAKTMKGIPVKAAIMSGSQGNPAGEDRRQGVLRGLVEEQLRTEGKASYEIVAQGWGAWNNEGGLKAMEDILTANPDINVLIGENDSMLLGAMKAIEAAGKTKQIKIFAACDGQKEGYQEIMKGGQYMCTGLNDPALISRTAVEIALKIMQGENNFPKISYTDPACITKDNVDKYYKEDSVF